MQFNDTTNENGICQEIDDICGSTVNTFSLKKKARRVNDALDAFYKIAFEEDANWLFDDQNQTDLPFKALANIVSGTQECAFSTDIFILSKLLVANSLGVFSEIELLDMDDVRAKSIFELPANNSGVPVRAVILKNSILLDPIPNYNYTNGLKGLVRRAGSKFVATDTTKEPGIPSLFHPYIARKASIPFLAEKKLPQLQAVMKQVGSNNPQDPYYGGDEMQIATFIASRNRVSRTKIVPKFRSSR